MRLILSVLVCWLAGSLVIAGLHYPKPGVRTFEFFAILSLALGLLAGTLVLLRRPWRFENLLRRLLTLLICFYAGLILGFWGQSLAGKPEPSVVQVIISVLSLQGALLVFVPPFLREHDVSWAEAFGFRRHWALAVLIGFVVAGLFLPIGSMLQWASAQVLLHLRMSPEQQQVVQTLLTTNTWPERLVSGLVTIVLVPPAEEICFRGILYPWIKQAGFPRLALWGTALLFGIMHVNLLSFIPLSVLAVALTLLYERTDNLLAPISAHALFNAMNFVLLYVVQDNLR
jgi:membrane protease YdiL (CAAX protease family)